MSGIGLLLSTARDALLAQQTALDVVGHNIANVNTEGYTRQIPVLSARDPAPYAGVVLGRGVDVDEVVRNVDNLIEERLMQRRSDLKAMEEEEAYMAALEALLNESSSGSLSSHLTDFWNAWHDLANNPSGLAERSALYERGALVCQALNDLSGDFDQLEKQINLALDAGVDQINELTAEIAGLNEQIAGLGVFSTPNDLYDKRQALVTRLSQYLDLQYYEDADGSLTVTTGRGYVLVSRDDSYDLSFDGTDVRWESSGTADLDITDTITGGKLGGWLEMRDVILPSYERDLNELAENMIWEVNQTHSLGSGVEKFTSVTGAYSISDSGEELGTVDSGLAFYDKITDGSFKLWLYDDTGAVSASTTLTIDADAGGTTASSLASAINAMDATHLTASVSNGKFTITASGGYSFAFSGDDSNVLAALGINVFFTGDDAESADMNSALESNKNLIAAARVGTSGQIATGDNTNALAMADLQYEEISMTHYIYTRGSSTPTSSAVTETISSYLYSLESSVGIRSQSITRSREYNEVIAEELSETRNNISAVSIDEELANLIKFQHAYSAAAKLVSTADEMFQTLLETR